MTSEIFIYTFAIYHKEFKLCLKLYTIGNYCTDILILILGLFVLFYYFGRNYVNSDFKFRLKKTMFV